MKVISRAPGHVIPHRPVSAAAAGSVVVIGELVLYTSLDIAAGELGELNTGGLVTAVKDNSDVDAGDALYWNPAGNPVGGDAGSGALTKTPGELKFAGYATQAAGSGVGSLDVLWASGMRGPQGPQGEPG